MVKTEREYEMMILVDPVKAASDFDRVKEEIESILNKHANTTHTLKKFGERRLAYVIKKNLQKYERGCYILAYFSMDTDKIPPLKRDCSLNDTILKVMIIKLKDKPTLEEVESQ